METHGQQHGQSQDPGGGSRDGSKGAGDSAQALRCLLPLLPLLRLVLGTGTARETVLRGPHLQQMCGLELAEVALALSNRGGVFWYGRSPAGLGTGMRRGRVGCEQLYHHLPAVEWQRCLPVASTAVCDPSRPLLSKLHPSLTPKTLQEVPLGSSWMLCLDSRLLLSSGSLWGPLYIFWRTCSRKVGFL